MSHEAWLTALRQASPFRKGTAMTTRGVLKPLLEQAILYGADSLLVECKDGFEEVFASRGEVGLGIASVRSSSPEATRLRAVLLRLVGRKRYALIVQYSL